MSDMEGVSGIVAWSQVNGGAPMYEEGRRLYTEEINAAVRGARSAGADEIVVVDCHGAGGDWSFNSLVPELLDEGCDWVAHHGWGRYTELLEQGCDAALMVGMHARFGCSSAGRPTQSSLDRLKQKFIYALGLTASTVEEPSPDGPATASSPRSMVITNERSSTRRIRPLGPGITLSPRVPIRTQT